MDGGPRLHCPVITGYTISTSKEKLSMLWVCQQLRASYWGGWLTDEQIIAACGRSLCFGVYGDDVIDGGEIALCGEQVAFGRVVTDGHTFSSVMDIIVEEKCRNQGIGTMLMNAMLEHPDVKGTVCIISTQDKGFWYEKFGFETCPIVLKRDPK